MGQLPLSGLVLVSAVALAPWWTVSAVAGTGALSIEPIGVVTFGRVLFVMVGIALSLDLVRSRKLPLTRFALLFAALLITLLGWVAINGSVWGCLSCEGSFGGFTDMVAAALLALAVLILHPRMAQPVLLAIVCACVFGAVLAVAGTGEFGGSLPAVTSDGRLAGPYGNANFLAFAIAPGIPILLALSPQWRLSIRLAALACCAILGVTLVLTYSRGGLITTGVAAVAVVVLQMPARRRLAVATALIVLLAGGGALAYPTLRNERLENLPDPFSYSELRHSIDRSGWDGTIQGLIPGGPSVLANRAQGTVLSVSPLLSQAGVSYPWGVATPDTSYTLQFQIRTSAPSLLRVGLEDNLLGNSPASRTVPTGPDWRTVELIWTPSARSPDARLYVWRPRGRGSFELRDVSILAIAPSGSSVSKSIRTTLLGSGSRREQRRIRVLAESGERYYIPSRWKGARLAVTAFFDDPLIGIGWEEFPELSNQRLAFGHLPTHNEYLRFAAELGILGLLLLVSIACITALALWSIPRGPLHRALAGTLIAGGLSILFVNGLVAPAAGGWLAIACAAAVASSRCAHAPS